MVRLALVFWGGFYLLIGLVKLPGDGDLYWQRWLGNLLLRSHHLPSALGSETFTAAGAPWVPQEWLFSLLVAIATNHHAFLLFALLVSAVPLLTLWLVYLRSCADASPAATGLAIAFCGFALAESFGVRAQVAGWAALAGFFFLIERRDRWYWAAIPLTIAWANIHASVSIAPAIIVARLAAIASEGGVRAMRASRELVMLPAVLLATICTPLGLRLPLYAVTLAHSPIRHYIVEWRPSGFGDGSLLLGALPLAIAIVLGGKAALFDKRTQSFPAAVLFAAALFAARNLPLFAIAASPLAAFAITTRFGALDRLNERVRGLAPAALSAMTVILVLSAVLEHQQQLSRPPALPVAAIAAIAADGADHRLLCEDFTWCSVALGYPRLRVFIDGRCDPYPLPVWQRYIATIKRKSRMTALVQYGVDSVVAARNGPVADNLSASGSWRVAFQDRAFVVFRRE